MNEKPFPNSYWVIPGKFLAGGYPGSPEGNELVAQDRLEALEQAGFDTFFDLTRPGELPAYLPVLEQTAARYNRRISYQRFPTRDMNLMPPEQMQALMESIESALAAGRKVYLHCWGGVGRTGTAVGCWLVRGGLSGPAALQRLSELYSTSLQKQFHPRSPETDAQVQFILDWQARK